MDWWKKKKQRAFDRKHTLLQCRERGAMLLEDLIECCDGKSNPIKIFSADLILKPIDKYDYEWFSGKTDNQRIILMKKYASDDSSGFCRDVAISSMVSGHNNFMKLAGCCLDYTDPVMVYYGEKKQYSKIHLENIGSWKRRMKIAEDIATALAYLHTAFARPFVYRMMSIENIVIYEESVAKLTDFSCCISIPIGETFVEVDRIIGTFGYLENEYMARGIVSEKTDAYGFGMFMLMLLIGGRERLAELAGDNWERNPKWVFEFIEEGPLVDEIVDPKMGEVTEEERCGMNAFIVLSAKCLGLNGEVPTMVAVAKELKRLQTSLQNS